MIRIIGGRGPPPDETGIAHLTTYSQATLLVPDANANAPNDDTYSPLSPSPSTQDRPLATPSLRSNSTATAPAQSQTGLTA